MNNLNRDLSLWGAASIGIGAIIGTGIFVLIGVASGLAGPAVVFSFIIAGLTALLTGLSSAELSSFITEEGGGYIYAHKAFGKLMGFVIGWVKSFDYIIGSSAVSIGFASYLTYFLNIAPLQSIIIAVATVWPIVLTILNLKGIKETSKANTALVILKISALIVFILVGTYYIMNHFNISNYQPFFPNGIEGVFSGAAIIFFAFIGFNTITIVSEEVKNPKKNIPKAVLLSFSVSLFLYIGVALVAIGLLNWKILGLSSAPLEAALSIATNNFFIQKFISISALFATTSVILSSIIGVSRILFSMARKNLIPNVLSKISKNGTPFYSLILCGSAIPLIVIFSTGNLKELASIFNLGTLLTFAFINLSLLQLRRTSPNDKRGFKVPFFPITPVAGVISCIFLSSYLSPRAFLYGGIWILFGLLIYYLNKKNNTKNNKPQTM